jgi:hypothetical protein
MAAKVRIGSIPAVWEPQMSASTQLGRCTTDPVRDAPYPTPKGTEAHRLGA